jgi:hypothetical protein
MKNAVWCIAAAGALLCGSAFAKEGSSYRSTGRAYGETQAAACSNAKQNAVDRANSPRHHQSFSACQCTKAFGKNTKYKHVCKVTSYNRTPARSERRKGSAVMR